MKILTIDGTSASGKGSVAREIAKILKFRYLDSGAIYRAFAYFVQKYNHSDANLADLCNDFSLSFEGESVMLNGRNITKEIRTEEIGSIASQISTNASLRERLLKFQRDFYVPEVGLTTDGRDMGSVVFPQAKAKVFLTADVTERSKRRFLQLKSQGLPANRQQILRDLQARDSRDQHRKAAPLIVSDDALFIDSTDQTFDAVFSKVLSFTIKKLQLKRTHLLPSVRTSQQATPPQNNST